MKLSKTMQTYVLHWGEMGVRWGVNRTVSQIHALLYLSERPLTADEITETLGVARSNVSTSLKELRNWELIKIVHVLGDRRDHFEAVHDVWTIFRTIVEQRKRREIDPTITVLRGCTLSADEDSELPAVSRQRMENVLEFLENLMDWYDDIKDLEPEKLAKLLRMGQRLRGLLGA